MVYFFKNRKTLCVCTFLLVVFYIRYEYINAHLYKNTRNNCFQNNDAKQNTLERDSSHNRLLCIILTSEKTFLSRSTSIWDTWAKKCHKAIFPCNCKDETINIQKSSSNVPVWKMNMTESYNKMGAKVFKILKSVYESHHNEFKWFLLADDDTFIFVNNLYSFIKDKSYNDPLTYGYNFKAIVPNGYHSGGAGVLLTHEALKRISMNIKAGVCNDTTGDGFGDIALGVCSFLSDVKMGDSLDEFGRERFHPFDIIAHYTGDVRQLDLYSSNGVKTGRECCSDQSISFHYTSPNKMKLLNDLNVPLILNNVDKLEKLFKTL